MQKENVPSITFFTVFSFIANRTDTVPFDAGTMTSTRGINTLADGYITFWTFPATVA